MFKVTSGCLGSLRGIRDILGFGVSKKQVSLFGGSMGITVLGGQKGGTSVYGNPL